MSSYFTRTNDSSSLSKWRHLTQVRSVLFLTGFLDAGFVLGWEILALAYLGVS